MQQLRDILAQLVRTTRAQLDVAAQPAQDTALAIITEIVLAKNIGLVPIVPLPILAQLV